MLKIQKKKRKKIEKNPKYKKKPHKQQSPQKGSKLKEKKYRNTDLCHVTQTSNVGIF